MTKSFDKSKLVPRRSKIRAVITADIEISPVAIAPARNGRNTLKPTKVIFPKRPQSVVLGFIEYRNARIGKRSMIRKNCKPTMTNANDNPIIKSRSTRAFALPSHILAFLSFVTNG